MSNWSQAVSGLADEGENSELILKLQALLQERNGTNLTKVSNQEVVKEVCNYIKKLHKQVDDLSERLSEVLASLNHNTTIDDPDFLRTLLQF